jgi:hypothetical protein
MLIESACASTSGDDLFTRYLERLTIFVSHRVEKMSNSALSCASFLYLRIECISESHLVTSCLS